jgi:hypothetical protein
MRAGSSSGPIKSESGNKIRHKDDFFCRLLKMTSAKPLKRSNLLHLQAISEVGTDFISTPGIGNVRIEDG